MLYDCRLYFVGNSNIIIINRPTAAHGPPRMRRNYMSDAAKRMLNEAAEFENLAKYLKVFFEVRQSCRQCSAKLSRNKIHVFVGLRLLLILMSFSVKSVKMNISSIKGPSIDDVHTEGGEDVRFRWTHVDGGGDQAPRGRPHRKLKLESTDVILSSSNAKKLVYIFTRFNLWTE